MMMDDYADVDLTFVLEPWQQYEKKEMDGRRVRFAVEEVRIHELRPEPRPRPLKRKRQDFSTLLLASEFLRGEMPPLVATL